MTKLTLNKLRLTTICMLILFFTQSCRKELLLPSKGASGLTITEAKSYFESNFKPPRINKGKTMSVGTGSGNESVTIESFLVNKQPIWEKAYTKLISTGNAVKIPLDFGKAYAIINEKTQESVPLNSLNYLFMYKDSLNVIHTEWVILKPDTAWIYGKRNTYTGNIIIKDWNGKALRNLYYKHTNSIGTTMSSAKNKAVGSKGKIQNAGGGGENELEGNAVGFCVKFPDGRCPKLWPCDAYSCDVCLTYCAKLYCNFFDCSPICDVDGEPGTGGGRTGGGGPVNPSAPGGGGAYPPDDCGGGGQLPRPPSQPGDENSIPVPPCIPKPNKLETFAKSQLMNILGLSFDSPQSTYLSNHGEVVDALLQYLETNGETTENKEFANWAIGYLDENQDTINFNDFKNEFLPTTVLIADPDADNWTDPDNEILVDPDQTVYQQYQDSQPWPNVSLIINYEKFVPNRYIPGTNPPKVENCLVLAKEQLAKKGYSVSGYDESSSQIFQIYKEATGVNLTRTREGISYMVSSLSNGIPILVGVDVRTGAPLANDDKSTDHFIVIVGMGTDNKGKYFQFYDSSTNYAWLGASKENKLYFDSTTGRITGKTKSQYANRSGHHDFILTQIRKSIKK